MATNVTFENPVLPVSSNTNFTRMARNHGLILGHMDSADSAAADTRGALQYVPGASGTADQLLITVKNGDDEYANVDLGPAAQLRTVVDTGGAFATPIVLTAADSGKTYLLDDAAGLDFTLPAIATANIGMVFRFRLITEVTSNSYRMTAGEATDLFIGSVVMYDKDVAEGSTEALLQVFRPDVSDDDALTIAGADDTTGCLVGGWLELEAITATRWFVSGVLIGDGALATIFA